VSESERVRVRVGGDNVKGDGNSDSGVLGVCGYQKVRKSDYSCVHFLGYNGPLR